MPATSGREWRLQTAFHAVLQTDEAVHAIRACINHLCGSTLPMLLQLQAPWHHDEASSLLHTLTHLRAE